jgi:hypothetical protein
MTAVSPDKMCITSAVAKTGPASGMGRPKISLLSVMVGGLEHAM